MARVQQLTPAVTKPSKRSPQPIAYRPGDAAQVLGVSRSTIYDMIAEGRLEARKLGTATVISHDELVRVLSASELSDATKRAQASIK